MAERALSIAVVARNASGWSGATTVLWEQTRRLAAAGHDVRLIAERIDAARFASAGVVPARVPRWPWGSWLKRRWFAAAAARRIARERFDLVHGHGDAFDQDVLTLHNCVHAAHEFVHGGPLPAGSGVGRSHARQLGEGRFRLLIANSALMREDVVRRFGVPPERVRVIHPGHDPARFRPDDRALWRESLRRRWGVASEDVVVGLVTSGDFAKRGLTVFLCALAALPEPWRARARAVVVGKETRPGPYLDLARSLGVLDRVIFEPPQARVEAYYHALDVYAHPALFEEFGLSVQEAMACGVPVLTTRRVGAAELWPAAWADWLAPSPSPKDLAARLARLFADGALRASMGGALATAVRRNDWDRYHKETWACYQELLNEGPVRRP